MKNDLEVVDEVIRTNEFDEPHFKQADVIQLVEDPFGSVWTTVYQAREGLYSCPSFFACLADPALECEILQRTDWLRHAESFNPGFTETGDGVFYENGRDDGFDFLVKAIYFHSLQQLSNRPSRYRVQRESIPPRVHADIPVRYRRYSASIPPAGSRGAGPGQPRYARGAMCSIETRRYRTWREGYP